MIRGGAAAVATAGSARALLEQIERQLLPNLAVLPFDAAAARRYGALRAESSGDQLRGETFGARCGRLLAIGGPELEAVPR